MKLIELLNEESKWTKHCYARDANHHSVPARSEEAVCWCLEGALTRCYDSDEAVIIAEHSLRSLLPGGGIANWQDEPERTYSEVRAILLELAEEGY